MLLETRTCRGFLYNLPLGFSVPHFLYIYNTSPKTHFPFLSFSILIRISLTMYEASFRRRRSFSKRGSPVGRSRRVSLIRRSQQPRKKSTSKILPRSASEPILWIVQLVPTDVVSESEQKEVTVTPLFINPTFYSCYDLSEPSPHVQALPRLIDPSEVNYIFSDKIWVHMALVSQNSILGSSNLKVCFVQYTLKLSNIQPLKFNKSKYYQNLSSLCSTI